MKQSVHPHGGLSKLLACLLSAGMLFTTLPSGAWAGSTLPEPRSVGNALRIGTIEPDLGANMSGTGEDRYAHAKVSLPISSDDFIVSMDYMPGQVSDAGFSMFRLKTSGGSADYIPQLEQRGANLRVKACGDSAQFDITGVFTAETWYHLDVVVKDGQARYYLDGECLQKDGADFVYTIKSDTAPDTFGTIGDETNGWYNFHSWFDNIILVEDGVVTWDSDFDAKSSASDLQSDGWTLVQSSYQSQEDSFVLDPDKNKDRVSITTAEAVAVTTEFAPQVTRTADSLFTVTAASSDGWAIPQTLMHLTLESDDPSVAKVSEDGTSVEFLQTGNANLTVTASYLGSVSTADAVTFTVSADGTSGNALRVGTIEPDLGANMSGTGEDRYAHARVPISVSSDDFIVSMDYMPGQDVEGGFSMFRLKTASGSSDYIPQLEQRGANLRVKACGDSAQFDIVGVFTAETWYHLDVVVKDGQARYYLDGECLQKDGADFVYTIKSDTAPDTFGTIGDETNGWYNFHSWFDNIILVEDGVVTWDSDFDAKSSASDLQSDGWTLVQSSYQSQEDSFVLDPDQNTARVSIDTVSASASTAEFAPGTERTADSLFIITAASSEGWNIPTTLLGLTLESNNPSVAKVSDDGTSVEFLQAGEADLTLTVSYLGSSASASAVTFTVTSGGSSGNALRVGTIEPDLPAGLPAGTERYAFAKAPLSLSSDDFIVSMDYMPGQVSDAGFSMFRLKTANGGTDYIPQLEQRGANLRVKGLGSSAQFDVVGVFEAETWYHLDVVVKDGEARYYLDGQCLQKDGQDFVYTITSGSLPDTFGTIGDENASWYNYHSWFDNIVVVENGTITWDSDFDTKSGPTALQSAGWTLSLSSQQSLEDSFVLDAAKDTPRVSIDTVSATAATDTFLPDVTRTADSLFTVTATSSEGWTIPQALLHLTLESNDPAVAKVSDDGTSVQFLNEGEVELTVTAHYLGSSAVANAVTFFVNTTGSSGNALRVGTIEDLPAQLPGGTERYAYAKAPLSLSSDDFIISMDYRPGQVSDAGFSMFRLKTASGATDYIPQLEQRGANLRVKSLGSSGQFDIVGAFEANTWYHLDVVVKDGEARYYLDGQCLQKDGADFVYTITSSTAPDTFGTIGDEAAGWYNYHSWFDNIVVIENGAVTWDSDFDGKSSAGDLQSAGWTLTHSKDQTLADSFVLDAGRNVAPITVADVDATASVFTFKPGVTQTADSLFAITATSSKGWTIDPALLTLSLESGDPTVAKVSDDGTSVQFLTEGDAALTLTVSYLGSTLAAEPVTFYVNESGLSGNALRVGTIEPDLPAQLVGTERYAYAKVPLSISSGSFAISMDYMPGQTSDAGFSMFRLKTASGSADYIPQLEQRGANLRVKALGTSAQFDIVGVFEAETWYHLEVVVENGEARYYLNGECLQQNGQDFVYKITSSTGPDTFGTLGDEVAGWYNYHSWFDNIMVVENGKVTWDSDFDAKSSASDLQSAGWTLAYSKYQDVADSFVLDPGHDRPEMTIASASVTVLGEGLKTGDSRPAADLFGVTATSSGGWDIPSALLRVSATPTDPDAAEVLADGSIRFLKAGDCEFSVTVGYLHSESEPQTVTIPVGQGNALQADADTLQKTLAGAEAITGENIAISFDYQNTEDPIPAVTLLSLLDGSGSTFGPAITVSAGTLSVAGTSASAPVDLSDWNNFVLCLSDGVFELYLNGQSIATGSLPTGKTLSAVKFSGAGALLDNFLVVQNGVMTTCDLFDGTTGSGWSGGSLPAEPVNAPAPKLQSVSVVSQRTMFPVGETFALEDALRITAAMTNGSAVPGSLCGISVKASDPSVIEVISEDGATSLHFVSDGTCTLTVTASFNGDTAQCDITLLCGSGNAAHLNTPTGVYGSMQRVLEADEIPTGDDYYVSYDILPQDGTYLYIWNAFDGSNNPIGPQIQQIGSDIQVNIDSYPTITGALPKGEWKNITVHVSGDQFTWYLDGVLQKIGDDYAYTIPGGTGKISKLGELGDASSSGANKDLYVDNVRIIENNTVIYSEDFNSGTPLDELGWTLHGTVDYAAPPEDLPLGTLASLEAETLQGVLPTNGTSQPLDQVIALTGTLTNGQNAMLTMGTVSCVSSRPDILEVTTSGGVISLAGKSEGTASLTITCNLLGTTRTVAVPIRVSDSLAVIGYEISNTDTIVALGGTVELKFRQLYEEGYSSIVTKDGLPSGYTIQLDNDNFILNDITLTGQKTGATNVTLSYTLGGEPQSSTVRFRVPGGSLQTGDGTRGVSGQAMRILADQSEQITADEYIISFDYQYPSWTEMYNYYTWYSYDVGGAATGTAQYVPPAILQTDGILQLYCWLNAPVTVAENLEPDVWHNITFHFQDNYDGQGGRRLCMYLDGKPIALDNGNYWVEKKENIKYPTLGWFGDTTANDVSYGDAYYDNIRIYQKSGDSWDLTTDQSFDDPSQSLSQLGWTTSGPNIRINTDLADADVGSLQAVTLSGRTGFQPGTSIAVADAITLTGIMSTGHQAITPLCDITYTSSNSSIMEVTDVDGVPTMQFKQNGICSLKASCTLFGVTRETELELIVSDTVITSRVAASLERSALAVGETAEPTILITDTSGASTVSLTLPAGVTAESTNPSILKVETLSDGTLKLTALSAGTAAVRLTYTVLGEQRSTETPVSVSVITSVNASLARTPIYVSDRNDILLTATLSNGLVVEGLPFQVSCSFSDPSAMEVISGGEDDGRLLATAPCESMTVSITASMGGQNYSAQLTFSIGALETSKKESTIYTEEKVANARANVEKYDWAAQEAAAAITAADEFLKNFTYEDMWYSWSPQDIPRTYSVNEKAGCPICGSAVYSYGIYPWKIDTTDPAWELYCPNCGLPVDQGDEGITLPTNNFLEYYKGGINAYGEFDAALAKRHNDELIAAGQPGNLVNRYYGTTLSDAQLAKLREKGISEEIIARITSDPDFGVDDGYGYIDSETGTKYALAALYAETYAWRAGPNLQGLLDLTDAYLYTGEQKYADAAIIMLDRIADVYPALDLREWRLQDGYVNGVNNAGKATNSVWECQLINKIMPAFDAVFPAIYTMGDEAVEFLASHSATQDKSNPDRIVKNFEDGVLRQIVPAWNDSLIHGNEGYHQASVTYAAVILDSYPETQDWLYRVFRTGGKYDSGNFYQLLVDSVDHDGQGYESPFYNSTWLSSWLEVANALDGYELPDGQPLQDNLESDPYENVKFRKMFYGIYPMILNDIYIANIGDTVAAGAPASDFFDKSQFITAFEKYGDPELAQVLYMLNGNSTAGLHGDIFSADPEALVANVEAVIAEYGTMHLPSTMLTGTGYAVLRDGESSGELPAGSYTLATLDMEILPETTCATAIYAPSLQLQASKLGDELHLSFDFEGDTSKTYRVSLTKYMAGWFGKYDIYLNGALVASNVSFSGSGESEETLGTFTLKAEDNILRFVCVGEGPDPNNGSKYKMAVRYLNIVEYKEGDAGIINQNTQRELWMTFGKNDQHDHNDSLNLGLVAYQLDLMPDLGYGVRMDASNELLHWVYGTLSHNTVLVNAKQQNPTYIGTPYHFDDSGFVKLFDVDASRSYEWTDEYRRTSAMIQIDDDSSYIVDLFRVSGGDTHEFSFHAAEGSTVTEGLNLTAQPGTYAGPDTVWGELPATDISDRNPGYYWLKNVETDAAPADQFSIDWSILDTYNVYGNGRRAETDVHLKLTMLGDYDSVSLADGIPPQKTSDSPESYRYVIVKNEGTDIDSLYTSVIEPYRGESNIASIEALSVTDLDGNPANSNEVRAIRVTLTNGRTDIIVNALDSSKTYLVDGKLRFSGFFGVHSEQDGEVVASYLNDGTEIGEFQGSSELTGTVVDFTRDLAVENTILVTLDQSVDPASLAGRYVYIDNDQQRNAVYLIESATAQSNGNVLLNIGDVTTVRSWANDYDFSQGYVYDLASGQTLRIPLSDLTTNFPAPPTYTLSVTATTGGTVLSPASGGEYEEGAIIQLAAKADSGYHFVGWVSSNGGSFGDASLTNTTFTMPAGAVTLTAQFAADEVPVGPTQPGSGSVTILYPEDFRIPEETDWQKNDDVNEAAVIREIQTGTDSTVVIDLEGPALLDNRIFKALQGSGKDLQVRILDPEGRVRYAWDFSGADIDLPQISMNAGVRIYDLANADASIRSITGDAEGLYLEFLHSGLLPGDAELTVDVSGRYADGTTLYFYQLDPTAQTVKSTLQCKVENGAVVLPLSECIGEYALSDTLLDGAPAAGPVDTGNPPTADTNPLLSWMFAAILALICLAGVSLGTFSRRRDF